MKGRVTNGPNGANGVCAEGGDLRAYRRAEVSSWGGHCGAGSGPGQTVSLARVLSARSRNTRLPKAGFVLVSTCEAHPLSSADPALAGGIRRANRPPAPHPRQIPANPEAPARRQQRTLARQSGFRRGLPGYLLGCQRKRRTMAVPVQRFIDRLAQRHRVAVMAPRMPGPLWRGHETSSVIDLAKPLRSR